MQSYDNKKELLDIKSGNSGQQEAGGYLITRGEVLDNKRGSSGRQVPWMQRGIDASKDQVGDGG